MPRLQKTEIYYDAGGRPVKTVNPDGSEQRVVYGTPNNIGNPEDFTPNPWERYTYDANDMGWKTHPTESGSYRQHWNTPKSETVDQLGRTIQTTEHNSQPNYNNPQEYSDVVMEYAYDIQGNLLKVTNAIGQVAFQHKYDLQKQPLWSKHIDSGESQITYDAQGKPIEGKDGKNAETLSAYDRLQRPTQSWSKNNSSDSLRLTGKTTYGDNPGVANPVLNNLLGKPYEQYDEAGKVTTGKYDFKGNLLEKTRNVLSETTLKAQLDNYNKFLIDWTGSPSILDSFDYTLNNSYDALNRVTEIQLPEDVNSTRKLITPGYNKAGALEKVSYDGAEYVKHIAYNAKGQRILLALGNDTMTRDAYDEKTFRLKRQRTEEYTYTKVGNTHAFAPTPGTNREDTGFDYDLVGNILKTIEERTDCGIAGSTDGADKLQRDFTYDPLYRIRKATGRESDTQNQNDYLYDNAPIPGTPNANNVNAYTRQYQYDEIGNVLQMKQTASGNSFTRDFKYNEPIPGEPLNTLEEVNTGGGSLIQDFTYDNTGNQLTAGSNRHYEWTAANNLLIYKNQVGTSDPTIFAQYDYSGADRVSKLVRTGTAVNPIYERTIYIDGIFEYHKLEKGTTYEKNYVHIMDDKSRVCMKRIGAQFPDDINDDTTFILENQIMSSTARLNTSGGVIDRQEYYPFGDSSLRTFSKKRYQYVGKEKDSESGLYYYGARYYAPWTCRFISVDPLAAKYPNLSSYLYAYNNPIRMNDPTGMEGKEGKGEAKSKDNINSSEKEGTAGEEGSEGNPKGKEDFKNDAEKAEKSGEHHLIHGCLNPDGSGSGDITDSEGNTTHYSWGVDEQKGQSQQNGNSDQCLDCPDVKVPNLNTGNQSESGRTIEFWEEVNIPDNEESKSTNSDSNPKSTDGQSKTTSNDNEAPRKQWSFSTIISATEAVVERYRELFEWAQGKAGKITKALSKFGKGLGYLGLAISAFEIGTDFKKNGFTSKTVIKGIMTAVAAGVAFAATGGVGVVIGLAYGLLDHYGYIDKAVDLIDSAFKSTVNGWNEIVSVTKRGVNDFFYGLKQGWRPR